MDLGLTTVWNEELQSEMQYCINVPHCLSGLDARAAAIVMRAVRNVALNGRAVLVTIHQPSIEIFEVRL